MDLHLTNKLALITGSTKGIGKAIAIEMACEGTDVIISGRSEAEVTRVVKEMQTMFPNTYPQAGTADIPTESQRATLLEKFPKVDILVNNMGISEPMEYWDIGDATREKFFIVNVLSGNALAKAHLPRISVQGFGRIALIANGEAAMPSGEVPQYSMIKTVNLSLTKGLSSLAVDTRVTANTITLSSTLTEGVEKMLENMYADLNIPREDWERDFMKGHRSRSQIQQLVRPEEISRLVTFMAGLDPSSLSGEALRIDDGLVPIIF